MPGRGEFDALRTYRYVYAKYSTGESELYDLDRDPDQLQSRHADPAYAVVRGRLARRLATLEDLRGSGLPHPAAGAAAAARLPRARLRKRDRVGALPRATA